MVINVRLKVYFTVMNVFPDLCQVTLNLADLIASARLVGQ